jgi:hypothetical protein
LAHPMIGSPLYTARSGSRIVPIGSIWTTGLSETRSQKPRRGVAQLLRRPRVGSLVHGQRDEHEGELEQNVW